MHPEWVRSLRDQCQAAGVPFLFKQWGEWSPDVMRGELSVITRDGEWLQRGHMVERQDDDAAEIVSRVGKKAAGRELDGREWNEFPDAGGAK